MEDQNQWSVDSNQQPIMWGNPYDLIDNKKSEVSVDKVQNIASQNVWDNTVVQDNTVKASNKESVVNSSSVNSPVVESTPKVESVVASTQNTQSPLQQTTPVQENQPIPQAPVQQTTQTSVQNNVPTAKTVAPKLEAWPSGFTKKLIWFIAKISGQPDPETWEWAKNKLKTNVGKTQNQNSWKQLQNIDVKKQSWQVNPFDSIMWWVTWFLDKVEKKVENVSGVNLDAPNMNNANKQNQQVSSQQKSEQQNTVTSNNQSNQNNSTNSQVSAWNNQTNIDNVNSLQ